MEFTVSDSFIQMFDSLSDQKQKATKRALEKLMTEPSPPSLRIRKFKGSSDLWIANVSRGDRIIFQQPSNETAVLLDVGSHDATYNKWNRLK